MFDIFHTKRQPRHVIKDIGGHHKFVLERRDLPSAGAQQYAFLSQGLPLYAVSRGNILVTNPLHETFPAAYAQYAVGLIGNPPSGYFQGQFTTQPLMNPNQANALGIIEPGQLPPGAYNSIPTGAPTLAP